jgi:NAD(P)H-hydrate epimerase
MGAARSGAGYVTLSAPASLHPVLASKLTETTHLPLPESEPAALAPEAAGVLLQAVQGYEAAVVGPGLGQGPGVVTLLQKALLSDEAVRVPLVLDADALNLLAGIPRWWERLKAPCVVTPHPGEMARLRRCSVEEVERDRLRAAQEAAEAWKAVVVLKGAFTVVASPQGQIRLSPFANPGLATAGTGDVLAGAIGGLLAQGMEPFDAAWAGVFLHAAAGEVVRGELGDAGTLASDLLPALPKAIKGVKEGAWGLFLPEPKAL